MKPMKVGVVGCGMISEIYLKNITTEFSNVLQAYACADLNPAAAQARAEQFGLKAMTVDELIADPEIEIVLNLTIPAAHYEISKRALLAGKHAYSEKPLATTLEEGRELAALAEEKGLQVAAAPDTFLGGGIQTCLKLIEEGAIGTPISAQGLMLAKGPESFHPNPAFFYQEGAGPLLDMGPYYYTALYAMFGKVKRVGAMAKCTYPTRKVLSEKSPKYGQEFPCQVDTFINSSLEFENGVIATVTTSWDMSYSYWCSGLPLLEVFGSEGTLIVPDPNTFGGIGTAGPMGPVGKYVRLRRGAGDFEDVPVRYGYVENSRGLGLADFAWSICNGVRPRVSAEGSLHVLEIMLGALNSARSGQFYEMTTPGTKPAAMYDQVPFKK